MLGRGFTGKASAQRGCALQGGWVGVVVPSRARQGLYREGFSAAWLRSTAGRCAFLPCDAAPQNACAEIVMLYLDRSKFSGGGIWGDGMGAAQSRAAVALGRPSSHPGAHDHAQVPSRSLPCPPSVWASAFPCRRPASFLIPALSPPSLRGWAGHQRPGFGRATLSPYRHRPTGSSS
ncbi:hypothetical protein D3C71_1249580 [compost metagenome]